jgi:hypothetical protein
MKNKEITEAYFESLFAHICASISIKDKEERNYALHNSDKKMLNYFKCKLCGISHDKTTYRYYKNVCTKCYDKNKDKEI